MANVALTLRPDMRFGTSPTEPVHAGSMYKKLDRPFFTLTTETYRRMVKPYGSPGSTGSP